MRPTERPVVEASCSINISFKQTIRDYLDAELYSSNS
jgi:hypothetical protein